MTTLIACVATAVLAFIVGTIFGGIMVGGGGEDAYKAGLQVGASEEDVTAGTHDYCRPANIAWTPGDEKHISLHNLFRLEDVEAAMQTLTKQFQSQHPGVNRGRLTARVVPGGVVLRLARAEEGSGDGC